MASLGELFIELGVLGDDEGAKKVAKSLDEVIDKAAKAAKQLKKQDDSTRNVNKTSNETAKKIAAVTSKVGILITGITGAIVALDKLTDSLVRQNQYWINLTRNSDIALGTFQKWGQVGAALDSSLGEQGAAGAIADLNKRLFEMKLTGKGYEGFAFASIMPTNAEDVLEQVRNRIKGLNDTAATAILERLGIDPRMLSVLRMTREEFEALNAEMAKYRLTPEQRQTIQEFHKQMSIVNVQMQYFKDRIILKIMPHFLNLMRNIEFITEGLFKLGKAINKVTGNFKPLILVALAFIAKTKPVAKFFKDLNIAFGGLLSNFPKLRAFFKGLGGVIGRAFLPLTAIYLLIDDVRAFVQGGRSGIGYLLALIEDIQDKINFETPEWLKNLLYVISKMPNLADGVHAVKDVAQGNGGDVNLGELATAPMRLMNPALMLPSLASDLANSIINNNQNQSKEYNFFNTINTNSTQQAIMHELTLTNALFSN